MPNTNSSWNWLWRAAILAVIAAAFALRIEYLTLFSFHIDEFYTLTAANFVAETGQPVYPTGYFYDPGLPYTYLIGFLFKVLDFSEAMGRLPAVFFGVLAVATTYWLGAHVLRARSVGLLAALLMTVSVDAVAWGGSARATTLAQWLVLLSAALLWMGLTRQSTRHRILFALSYGLALLSHFSVVALLPAWFAAGLGLWWIKAVKFSKSFVRDGIFFLLVAGLALSSGVIFQPPPSVKFQTSGAGLNAKTGALSDKFLQIPSDLAHAWKAYGDYFTDMPHLPVTLLALLGLALTFWQLVRKERAGEQGSRGAGERRFAYRRQEDALRTPVLSKVEGTHYKSAVGGQRSAVTDVGALYLGLILLTVMAVLALVIAPHWQRNRYLVMQASGFFFLLGAYGLWRVIALLTNSFVIRHSSFVILGFAMLFPFLAPLQQALDIGELGWNRYDLAFGHIRDNLSEGDQVMTMNPPPAALYLGQNNYYLIQSSPKLLARPDGSLGDRYTGATWIGTVEEFNQLLTKPERLWLVTQEFWLFNSYEPYLQQQILQWMDKKWGEGGVWALSSRPGMWELAREMETLVNGEFEGGMQLLGFTADPPTLQPGGVMHLTLFWGGETMPYHRKIFVQLRDADNQTIAQADHFIYDEKVPSSRWKTLLKDGGFVRDGVSLVLPPDLPPGSYRIVVGFYHPETFERIGVINDQSGEAAIILDEFILNK